LHISQFSKNLSVYSIEDRQLSIDQRQSDILRWRKQTNCNCLGCKRLQEVIIVVDRYFLLYMQKPCSVQSSLIILLYLGIRLNACNFRRNFRDKNKFTTSNWMEVNQICI